MESNKSGETEFRYRRKPAFISFLLTYILCFGIAFILIDRSPSISKGITAHILESQAVSPSHFLNDLPYGIIFSLPFLICGIYRVLWNVMSCYEFSASHIRLLTGSLIRRERFFQVHEFFDISFKQNLLETPFGVGSLTLTSIKSGKRMTIKGVYRVTSVAEALRSGLGAV
jgi:hypothetical protein